MFLNTKKVENSPQLSSVDQLLVESGVSQKFFVAAFLGSLERISRYFEWNDNDKSLAVKQGRVALAKRRQYLLPYSCDPEQLHREKDRWTLAVWVAHLLLLKKEYKGQAIYAHLPWLEQMLDPKSWELLRRDITLIEAITEVVTGAYNSENAKILYQIVGNKNPEAHDKTEKKTDNEKLKENEAKPQTSSLTTQFVCHLNSIIKLPPEWMKYKNRQFEIVYPRGVASYAISKGIDFAELNNALKADGLLKLKSNGKDQVLFICNKQE